jgi:hypothetical protein
VLDYPSDWLLLTVPFLLAAIVASPHPSRPWRAVAAVPLVGAAVLWPTLCTTAAAAVRSQVGVPSDAWFVTHVDGYVPGSYSLRPGGIASIDYNAPGDSMEADADLTVASWPAVADSPCATQAACSANPDGTWSITDEYGDSSLVARRGARYLSVEVSPASDTPIAPGRLPAILAAVHVADDHEVLALVNGY